LVGAVLAWWTIGRATSVGVVAALVSLLLWLAFGAWPATLLMPFVAALLLAAFCGLSILWITVRDMVKGPRRGKMMRAVRGFDIALGLALAVPAIYALSWLAPALGL
jgi:hypothetical protein